MTLGVGRWAIGVGEGGDVLWVVLWVMLLALVTVVLMVVWASEGKA